MSMGNELEAIGSSSSSGQKNWRLLEARRMKLGKLKSDK